MAMIYVGIDGTGEGDAIAYSKEMANSFVKQLWSKWKWRGYTHYLRGPTALGLETKRIADDAVSRVQRHLSNSNKPLGIFLAGYSRGGAAAIEAARSLKALNLNVDCLLLFDAVDRTNTLNADFVPDNVKACYHAVRDPLTNSRNSFGNCGRKMQSIIKTNYTEKLFFCTHGGVGGAPWATGTASGAIYEKGEMTTSNITPAMDKGISRTVWAWMSANCQREIQACLPLYAPVAPTPPGPPTRLDKILQRANAKWDARQAAAAAEQAAYEKRIGYRPR